MSTVDAIEALRALEKKHASTVAVAAPAIGQPVVYRYTAKTQVEQARQHQRDMQCEWDAARAAEQARSSSAGSHDTRPGSPRAFPSTPNTTDLPPVPAPIASVPAPIDSSSAAAVAFTSTASAAMLAAVEADEAGDPITAMPKYIEAAEAYMRLAASGAASGEQSAKWSRQARSCVDRAETQAGRLDVPSMNCFYSSRSPCKAQGRS